jgi:GNAT superfamily N-acetyltransferase
MRVRHLASLEEPQELYLERRVAQGSPCLLEEDGAPAGYAVIDDGGTLLELFHEDFLAPAAVFSVLTASASVTSCLYQSFDLGMARLAATVQGRIEPVGIVFRNVWDPDHRTRSDISMRPATQADLLAIVGINDGFFADIDEIRGYLDRGGLSILESADTRIVGCGITEPVLPNGADVDIGMLVAPDFRRQGYGTYIVSHLKRDLLSKGLRPICGCAIGNTGLLRAVRNAGFTSDHRLLLFKP